MNAVVLDDDKTACELLEKVIQEFTSGITGLFCTTSPAEAMQYIIEKHPDVLFVDMDMPEMDGISFIKTIPENIRPYVIVVSAYDDYLVEVIKEHVFDYVFKPYGPRRIKEAVEALMQHRQREQDRMKKKNPDFIIVNRHEKCFVIPISDIVYLKANGAYSSIYLKDGNNIVASKPISHYADLLKEESFVKPHRSYLINVNNIVEIEKTDGDGIVVFQENVKLFATRDLKNSLIQMLEKRSRNRG